jgi:hypothetical protein
MSKYVNVFVFLMGFTFFSLVACANSGAENGIIKKIVVDKSGGGDFTS